MVHRTNKISALGVALIMASPSCKRASSSYDAGENVSLFLWNEKAYFLVVESNCGVVLPAKSGWPDGLGIQKDSVTFTDPKNGELLFVPIKRNTLYRFDIQGDQTVSHISESEFLDLQKRLSQHAHNPRRSEGSGTQ